MIIIVAIYSFIFKRKIKYMYMLNNQIFVIFVYIFNCEAKKVTVYTIMKILASLFTSENRCFFKYMSNATKSGLLQMILFLDKIFIKSVYKY